MSNDNETNSKTMTRRELLKASGIALGGLAFGNAFAGTALNMHLAGQAPARQCQRNGCGYPVNEDETQEYDYPNHLPEFTPSMQAQLDDDEMRITILGSAFPPARKAQQMMSIFVEVGPWVPDENGGIGRATDSFVFDCGAGVIANYNAMGISYGRMDKIFITHLHADHMSDLSAIYCFGPAEDRKSPLYVWGQGPSGVLSPRWGRNPPRYYDDGTNAFCRNLREAMRWHTESFSFLSTSASGTRLPTRREWQTPCDLNPVSDDPRGDGYAMVPIQLDWRRVGGVAYDNRRTGVKITHFPVIHTRKGSMGYKLEWNGLSMIYTSDTRPEWLSIRQNNKSDGVDVFIHEMILPPELLAMKNMDLDQPNYRDKKYVGGVEMSKTIIESSHSPQGAVGYMLSQMRPRPKLAVIAHFPVANDTVRCAMKSIKAHFPKGAYPVFGQDIIWSTDLMVLRVKNGEITQYQGKVPAYAYAPPTNMPAPDDMNTPKYHTFMGGMDPTAQLDLTTLIPPGKDTYCVDGY